MVRFSQFPAGAARKMFDPSNFVAALQYTVVLVFYFFAHEKMKKSPIKLADIFITALAAQKQNILAFPLE